MYQTSAEYKTAIRQASRPFDTVYGTVTFPTSSGLQPLTVDSSVMPTNSITISKQCIDSDELEFGGVYASTLKLSLFTDLDRYSFFGAKIELFYKIEIAEDTFETIPLGIYTVADADRPHDIVNLTAYDNMTLLDKDIGGIIFSGTIWQLFEYIQRQTGYQLAFTQSDLLNFPNNEYTLEMAKDHGINTYRDAVKTICQLLGCFALDDRTGKLQLKKFSVDTDLALSYTDWYSCVPADYLTNYIGLSVTGLNGTYSAGTQDPNEVGSVMIIDDAPAWDLGSETSLTERTTELFTYLHTIAYTPSEIEMPSDPSFDCGDRLSLTLRGTPEITLYTLITSYEWKFHQGMSIHSEGINPYLMQEVVDQHGQRILSQAVAKSKLQFIHFTNEAERVIADDQDKMIARVEFTPTANTDALFVATILLDADVEDTTTTEQVEVPVKAYNGSTETQIKDINGNVVSLKGIANNTHTRDGKCDVTFYYRFGTGTELHKVPSDLEPYLAVEEIENGQHIVTLSYPITNLGSWERATWEIWATVDGGVVRIPENSVKASIFGQEVDVVGRFSGKITAEDELTLDYFAGLGVLEINDDVEVVMRNAVFESVSDTVSLYNISSVQTIPLYEGTGELRPNIEFEGGLYITAENEFDLTDEEGNSFITD